MFCSVPGDRERRKVRGSKAQTTNTSHMVQHSYHAIDIVSACISYAAMCASAVSA